VPTLKPSIYGKPEALNNFKMGIKHLYQLIQEHSPDAIKTGEIKNQFGRKVAIVSHGHWCILNTG
jgi:hypothetical protein